MLLFPNDCVGGVTLAEGKAIQSLIHLRLEGELCAADDLPGYSGTALLCIVYKAEKQISSVFIVDEFQYYY